MAPSAGGKVKLGLASLLSGYSLEELGFNPVSIPAWLQTNLEASTLRDQIPNGTVMIDLGTIIDGVSDIGFRNMLTGAKREFGVKLPQNEVFHALTNSQDTPPPAAAAPALPATVPPMTIQPAAPPQNAFVPPQEAPSAAMFTPAPAPATAMDAPAFAPSPPVAPAFAVTPVTAPPAPPAPIAFSPFPQAPSESRALFEANHAHQPAAQPPGNTFAPPAQPPQDGMASLFSASTLLQKASSPAPATATSPAEAAQTPPPSLLQPKPGVFSAFGPTPPSEPAPAAPQPQSTFKAFDPFATSAAPSGMPPQSGLSSAQLLGQETPAAGSAFATTKILPSPATKPLIDPFASPQAPAAPLIPENPAPSNFFAAPAPQPPVQPAFAGVTAPLAAAKPAPFPAAPEIKPPATAAPSSVFAPPQPQAAKPAPPAPPAPSGSGRHSYLGLNPLDTQTDQLLLRALLGTEEKLDASTVVRLLASQPGLCACVCLDGSSVLSHANADSPDAASFQQQAAEIARQVRALAPLIGISDAETFTLNASGRLITFCFPGEVTVGVLHECEPTTGLRDKITLVARELARMLA